MEKVIKQPLISGIGISRLRMKRSIRYLEKAKKESKEHSERIDKLIASINGDCSWFSNPDNSDIE